MNVHPPEPAERPDEQRGLRCPKCGCEHLQGFYTRRTRGGKSMRSRECRQRGRRVIAHKHVAFSAQ